MPIRKNPPSNLALSWSIDSCVLYGSSLMPTPKAKKASCIANAATQLSYLYCHKGRTWSAHHMWIFGNLWDDLASRQEIPWHLVKVRRCLRLNLPSLWHRVFLQHNTAHYHPPEPAPRPPSSPPPAPSPPQLILPVTYCLCSLVFTR